MACLILMYASWEGEFPVSTALKYARMGICVLANLALRGSSWPETCIEAIKGMESALSMNAAGHQQNENPTGAIVTERQSAHHNPAFAPGRKATKSVNGQPTPGRSRQSAGANLTPARPENPGAGVNQDCSSTVGTQQLDPVIGSSAARGFDTGEHYDSATFSPQIPGQGHGVVSSDGFYTNGQTSAGLIFGNMANSNAPFNPGIARQDLLPFSDPSSFLMSDLWSVADGPWMIHGNLL